MDMSQCKKFAPNIFHKTKCSNCFRQKEEHTAEALECNRASRSIARSGYLFVAPDWDFSVPLNRTKRWQRRWFVLYDDGELNYSVDEHPDTVPQGSVDMSKVLEVTGAEQVTGHPHSLALTAPDRVTFVKAASREDARWWADLLAVFPRRHKRNATFPGGRASPSLPQLGRSASPQPPRPRHLSCTGPSPRTNFTTPPLKEERESPAKEETPRPVWLPEPTTTLTIDTTPPPRTDYVVTSGSPPTRDKLRYEEKARTRRDWRHERLRDIATALTDRSPESSLALPAEGLLNLKKGWLWYKEKGTDNEWLRRWWVLCGPTLIAYCEQDEQGIPEVTIELSTVTGCIEALTDTRYGFQIQWSGPTLILAAVTSGIRSNWLQALKKATPAPLPAAESPVSAPATPRSTLFSSDEEYRTASEGGRRDSGDWSELPPSPPLSRTALAKVKERTRARPKLPRSQSRQSTLDSVSTDELDGLKEPDEIDYKNMINKQTIEVDGLRKQLSNALSEIQHLESELTRYKKIQTDSVIREKQEKEIIQKLEKAEHELNQKLKHLEERHAKEQKGLHNRLMEIETIASENEQKYLFTSKELQTHQKLVCSLQEELKLSNERHAKNRQENDRLYKKLQELECKPHTRRKRLDSLTDLTDINLDVDLENLNHNELIEQCLDLRSRFEKAVVEIRVLKRELRESHVKYDQLELQNVGLKKGIEMAEQEAQAQSALMADRVQDLTAKLATVEKQARTLKSKLQDSREKRRSLSLKGRENFSINKEVEDKITELEAKIMTIERDRLRRKHRRERSNERTSPIDDRSLRRIRRKSLDSATSSEPMKLLMRLSNLEGKVSSVTTSNESINTSSGVQSEKTDENKNLCCESIILAANEKLRECKNILVSTKLNSGERLISLENNLSELGDILSRTVNENELSVVKLSANTVVKQFECLLREKLKSLYEKRRILQESNELNDQTRLELLAEKLAYENLIIERIQQAAQMSSLGDNYSERLLNKEAIETTNLLHTLRSKLNGINKKQPPAFKTSVEYLTKVLTKHLLVTQHHCNFINKNKFTNSNFNQFVKLLEEEQSKINNLLHSYKSNKLPQLSEALAIETINLATDQTCHIKSFDKDLMNDMWKTAKEIVNTELIQSEINHTLMRTAQIYEEKSSADQSNFFSFYAYERAALELWSDSVESRLRVEMDRNIEELTESYKQSLQKLQRQNWRRRLESERSNVNINNLLGEYADIIAHKSLIDARISVLKSDFSYPDEKQSTESCNVCQETLIQYLQNDKFFDNFDESDAISIENLETEFRCMFRQFSAECLDSLARTDLMDVRVALQDLSKEIFELACFCSCGKYEEKVEVYNVQDVCRKCKELRSRLNEIKQSIYEIKRTKRSEDEDRKPLYLGTEYLNQVENLRAAYRRTLTECENHKQQADLEQLQFLCEQVLVAMEHWHRRTLQDLREQHSRELQAVRQDKEQALAEETQATLAALDAMRKAHEAEVQREVVRFKQDFAREQQDELLELTERLSVKCLEAAALEEQLGSATRQLAHAQQHILQLERNPQLSLQN